MMSMRGGFRSAVGSATGTGPAKQTSQRRRMLGNVVTAVLLIVAALLVLRRFGVLR